MGSAHGICPWGNVLVMRKFDSVGGRFGCVVDGFSLGLVWGGRGRGRGNSRSRTPESFSEDDTSFRTVLFMLHIICSVVEVLVQYTFRPSRRGSSIHALVSARTLFSGLTEIGTTFVLFPTSLRMSLQVFTNEMFSGSTLFGHKIFLFLVLL